MNKKIVLSLYKNKLKISHELGYKYGKWNNFVIIKNHKNSVFKYLKRKRRYKFGDVIMNNVRYWYKINKNETDNNEINKHIDYGFDVLKYLNDIKNKG